MENIPTIAAKAATLPNKAAIPLPAILQIIMSILAMFGGGGICPQPTPPAKGPGERWYVRRHVRKELDDPQAYHEWGMKLADDILESASTSTPEEWTKMVGEAKAAQATNQ